LGYLMGGSSAFFFFFCLPREGGREREDQGSDAQSLRVEIPLLMATRERR
jgi:hypothetical protein